MSVITSRMLFPLTPIFAALALSSFGFFGAARGLNKSESSAPPVPLVVMSAKPLNSCCQKQPTRGARKQNYAVKFSSHSLGQVDYDAGGGNLEINCAFTDLDTEHPVVGMSSIGLLRRVQTDTGTVVDGSDGFAVITPGVSSFKDARLQIRAKVPLHTRSLIMLNGALTVLRAYENTDFSWREPFSSQIGITKKSAGFEMTLTKVEMNKDTVEAEWACKPSPDAEIEEEFWDRRKLQTTLTFADQSTGVAETGTDSPYLIRRVFRHNKKFPVSLNITFISNLKRENLPFTLTDIVLEESAPSKPVVGGGQNF